MLSFRLGATGQISTGRLVLALAAVAVAVACGGDQPRLQSQTDIGYPIRETRDADAAARRWLDFRQIDRIAYTNEFKAADYRQPNTDVYVEGRQAPPLDILMVIDNSMSMEEAQRVLASGLAPLLASIQTTDWHIYVVTTDDFPESGTGACHPGTLIKKGDPNLQQAFTAAVTVGASGDSTERGIQSAHDALARPCNGVQWLRSTSRLAILFVSNEDNCSSNGIDCAGTPWSTANYLYDYLAQIRRPGDDARVYGVIFHPDQPDCEAGTWRGGQYADLIRRTRGSWQSICDTDYSPVLTQLSFDARALIPPSIPLSQSPRNAQIAVTVDGTTVPAASYQLQGQNVVMKELIFEGQEVKISYIYDQPYTRDFALLNAAYPDTVHVETNGAQLGQRSFTYATANQTVSIGIALDPNQLLKVTYRENKPLRSVFFVGPVIDVSLVHCFLNSGTEITGFTYDAVAQTLIFSQPPTELLLFKCQL